MLKRFLMIYLLLLPFSTLAHSPLVSMHPSDGAVLSQVPAAIEMVFKSPAKLIKLEVYKVNPEETGSLLSSLFGSKAGDDVFLDNSSLMRVSETHKIALPLLDIGTYTIQWRAIGEDGHVIKGGVSFQVSGS